MVRYLLPRPQPLTAVQWNGSNFTEVWGFVDALQTGSIVDNQDGTLTLHTVYVGDYTLATGDWVIADGGMPSMLTATDAADRFAEVDGPPPFAYVVDGAP